MKSGLVVKIQRDPKTGIAHTHRTHVYWRTESGDEIELSPAVQAINYQGVVRNFWFATVEFSRVELVFEDVPTEEDAPTGDDPS